MSKKAFTLIELLVVVLIIGILAAIALPQYNAALERSRRAEALLNLKALTDSMQRYVLQNGKIPIERTSAKNMDIDLSGGTWGNSWWWGVESFITPHFDYLPYCERGQCTIYICRMSNNDCVYHLFVEVLPNQRKECYTCKSSLGRKMCEGLEGFTVFDVLC